MDTVVKPRLFPHPDRTSQVLPLADGQLGYAEFGAKDIEQILATMVPNPSVNHVPVMTGAIGREQVREFYTKVFLPQLPSDLEVIPISRTIGQGRVVDEFARWETWD